MGKSSVAELTISEINIISYYYYYINIIQNVILDYIGALFSVLLAWICTGLDSVGLSSSSSLN